MNEPYVMKKDSGIEIKKFTPLEMFSFPESTKHDFMTECSLSDLTTRLWIRMVDDIDNAIVNAIIDEAKANGVTHCAVINKHFVVDAIREKMIREGLMNAEDKNDHERDS